MSKEKLNRAFAARKAKEDKKLEEKPKKEINLQPFVDRFTQ